MLRFTSSGFGSDAGDGADGANVRGDSEDFGVTRPESTERPGGADVVAPFRALASSSGLRAGESGVFSCGDDTLLHALCVSVFDTVLLPFPVAVVVDVVVVELHPRGDVDSTCSTPLNEKLPNCSDKFVVAALSHLPILRYCFGLAELETTDRDSDRGI